MSLVTSADRAKQIKTVAKVNEDPTEKLIRQLQEENKKLKEMLASGKLDSPRDADDEDDGEYTDAGRCRHVTFTSRDKWFYIARYTVFSPAYAITCPRLVRYQLLHLNRVCH